MAEAIYEVSFNGSSDDNFQLNGDISDEVGCYSDIAILRVEDPKGQCINVVGEYGRHDKGNWMIGLQVVEDGDSWPEWWIQWGMAKNGYSPKLTMRLPEGTTITQLWPEVGFCEECKRPHEAKKWVLEK